MACVLGLCVLGLCAAAQAQTPAEKRASIDHLLDALKAAPDEQAAAMLEAQLQQIWLHAGSRRGNVADEPRAALASGRRG